MKQKIDIVKDFNGLSDHEKVEVMQQVIRQALLHLRTARAPGSDYITFMSFVAGPTFEEVVMRPLEMISSWSIHHTDKAYHRAERIKTSVEQASRNDQIKSPTAKFRHLKQLLLGGGVAVGLGLGIVARAIYRAQKRKDIHSAHK